MKLSVITYSDIKAEAILLSNSKQEIHSMPLPGATCSVVGATCTCCSCCFAN